MHWGACMAGLTEGHRHENSCIEACACTPPMCRRGRAMTALLAASEALWCCLTPRLREGRAPAPPSLFRSFPLQVSQVFHTRLFKLESLVSVGDKDPQSVIKPCQNDRNSPFTMLPQPMSQLPARVSLVGPMG